MLYTTFDINSSSYKKALVANIIDYDTSDDLSDLIGDVGSLTITEERTPVVNKRTHSEQNEVGLADNGLVSPKNARIICTCAENSPFFSPEGIAKLFSRDKSGFSKTIPLGYGTHLFSKGI